MGKQSFEISLYSFFEFALQDLRKNAWRLYDIFGAANSDILSKVQFGEKEYKNAYDWFLNNNISVVMQNRVDTVKLPCISIALSRSAEDVPHASLNDDFGSFTPSTLGEFVDAGVSPQVHKMFDTDFTPKSYDKDKGYITLPDELDTYQIGAGYHMLVDSSTNTGHIINKVLSGNTFQIESGTELNLTNVYIAPIQEAFIIYRKRARFKEVYEIGVHAVSQAVEAVWLGQIVEYILLAYKKYLDSFCRNMDLSTFSASAVSQNDSYQGDKAFSKFFSLSFDSEMTWIEDISPRVGRVNGGIIIKGGPKTPEELSEYLKTQYIKMEGDVE